jgi:carbamoyltransferase
MTSDQERLLIGYANTFHDPAIALAQGDQIFAEAIERHAQVKRALWMAGMIYSVRPIKKSASALGFSLDQASEVSIRSTWDYGFFSRIATRAFSAYYRWKYSSVLQPESSIDGKEFFELLFFSQIWFEKARPVFKSLVKNELFPKKQIQITEGPVPHHLAHAANAVLTSPFDECAVMVVDGSAENSSSSFYHFKDGRFRLVGQSSNFHSLGLLYAQVTRLCGFSPIDGEEWKVMGLAAYGSKDSRIQDFFRSRCKVQGLKIKTSFTAKDFEELSRILGGFRDPADKDIMKSANLAYNFQEFFTDTLCQIASNFYKLGLSENLAYSGGCALNSSTNGVLLSRSGFKTLHIPSAPADDGNALGAALLQKQEIRPRAQARRMSPYLGSAIDTSQLEQILAHGGIEYEKPATEELLLKRVAELLSQGQIIGWMQGRAEFGPRALGNRSILADPRRAEMKDKVNALVKFREAYRPLAPSILHEKGPEYFENYQESPYMDRTLKFRADKAPLVPAVVHADGTGRLQSVYREWNPRYHGLIREFESLTGIPLILNSSLNVMGKPIVHSVEDALSVLYTTGMPIMVIGDYILKKPGVERS